MHIFDEEISILIVHMYNTNVITCIKCFIGTHVWMFINANPKYLCRSDIFVFNTHTCIWTCSLSMYRLFVFQSLAESWIVSTNYLKQECLAMNGEWANFLEKKKDHVFHGDRINLLIKEISGHYFNESMKFSNLNLSSHQYKKKK